MVAGGMIGTTTAIYRWTSGGKGSIEGATLASFFLPQFNTIVLVLASIFGLVHLLLVHSLTQAQLIGFGATMLILMLIIGGAALVVHFRGQAIKAIIGVSSRVARLERKSFDPNTTRQEANDLFATWDVLWQGAWHRPMVRAFLNVAFDMLTLYFMFVAAGENVSLGVLLAGYGLPLLLGKVAFIIPGGVGVVESSMATLYTGLGVPQATAVVVVLGYRLISFWIPSLAGLPYKSAHKFRYGHAVYGLQHAQTMADYKAVSLNLIHEDIKITDQIYAPILNEEVAKRIGGLSNTSVQNQCNELVA